MTKAKEGKAVLLYDCDDMHNLRTLPRACNTAVKFSGGFVNSVGKNLSFYLLAQRNGRDGTWLYKLLSNPFLFTRCYRAKRHFKTNQANTTPTLHP